MPPARLAKILGPVLGAAALSLALPAAADPMDLSNATARWVAVRFEVSPEDRPAQTRARFSGRVMARLEPGALEGTLEVTVPGPAVEEHLFIGQEPSPGSFSDFVWTFDRESGHVLSAHTMGVLLREIGWRFARWKTDAAVDVTMDTLTAVGFQESRLMGDPYPKLCREPDPQRCTIVSPARYDPVTGYVNAVGHVTARSAGMTVQSFSPLGEALFSEIDDPFDAIWTRVDAALHTGDAAPPP